MTSRERLLHVLHGKVPDCVPCCPDISNMVPCRLTGKPFWDVYLFNKIPLWRATPCCSSAVYPRGSSARAPRVRLAGLVSAVPCTV